MMDVMPTTVGTTTLYMYCMSVQRNVNNNYIKIVFLGSERQKRMGTICSEKCNSPKLPGNELYA